MVVQPAVVDQGYDMSMSPIAGRAFVRPQIVAPQMPAGGGMVVSSMGSVGPFYQQQIAPGAVMMPRSAAM